ncbi:hypothetical protein K0M31_012009 [Melipona bicolor]|uniref:Uncharacterized protein n=1 Tax=Melipona bicolor TaxID=60889 RepID=A0AA40KVC0_9HYME|nr:hypothetical protein K0M31_012009 [Melipona bicolor]
MLFHRVFWEGILNVVLSKTIGIRTNRLVGVNGMWVKVTSSARPRRHLARSGLVSLFVTITYKPSLVEMSEPLFMDRYHSMNRKTASTERVNSYLQILQHPL